MVPYAFLAGGAQVAVEEEQASRSWRSSVQFGRRGVPGEGKGASGQGGKGHEPGGWKDAVKNCMLSADQGYFFLMLAVAHTRCDFLLRKRGGCRSCCICWP